ncbi:MAG: hypothetical protein IT203_11345 [Fimbriimonadaceae bacterium]|nr:hypothetical protein [Fimbriimonadaceae bacterium]
MLTPFDWQEGIGNRAQYIEGKLKQGAPVLAVSLDSGILIYSRRRQSRKIFEIYDRLAFSAIGQHSDIEALRNAAVEFAHQEGFNRSEEDVTIQRVVTALSQPVKSAFGDFAAAPLVVRCLFAEVNAAPEEDAFYVLDYDGDYILHHGFALVTGSSEMPMEIVAQLESIKPNVQIPAARKTLAAIWESAVAEMEDLDPNLVEECLSIERSDEREDRFRLI